jgi:DNA (cytosine-5)-methyltransferase 1
MKKNMTKTVDLFAGCGGLSREFQDAGFEIIGAFEYWSPAAACYEANFTHPVYHADLSETSKVIPKIRMMNFDTI